MVCFRKFIQINPIKNTLAIYKIADFGHRKYY
jgi:hypothetical protein